MSVLIDLEFKVLKKLSQIFWTFEFVNKILGSNFQSQNKVLKM